MMMMMMVLLYFCSSLMHTTKRGVGGTGCVSVDVCEYE